MGQSKEAALRNSKKEIDEDDLVKENPRYSETSWI